MIGMRNAKTKNSYLDDYKIAKNWWLFDVMRKRVQKESTKIHAIDDCNAMQYKSQERGQINWTDSY